MAGDSQFIITEFLSHIRQSSTSSQQFSEYATNGLSLSGVNYNVFEMKGSATRLEVIQNVDRTFRRMDGNNLEIYFS